MKYSDTLKRRRHHRLPVNLDRKKSFASEARSLGRPDGPKVECPERADWPTVECPERDDWLNSRFLGYDVDRPKTLWYRRGCFVSMEMKKSFLWETLLFLDESVWENELAEQIADLHNHGLAKKYHRNGNGLAEQMADLRNRKLAKKYHQIGNGVAEQIADLSNHKLVKYHRKGNCLAEQIADLRNRGLVKKYHRNGNGFAEQIVDLSNHWLERRYH